MSVGRKMFFGGVRLYLTNFLASIWRPHLPELDIHQLSKMGFFHFEFYT
jgi:hypothetical protein